MTDSRTARWFSTVEPTAAQQAKLLFIEEACEDVERHLESDDADPAFLALAEAIGLHCDGNREKTMAIMRLRLARHTLSTETLREAMFWARESIVNPS